MRPNENTYDKSKFSMKTNPYKINNFLRDMSITHDEYDEFYPYEGFDFPLPLPPYSDHSCR